ncbi:hypothetical protein [Sinosporangium siamense]|uniref:Uncharacterized protein n=1 Tax=Sinosporangium siamense TaxID=1367973 RepID=A0A919V7S9_9ACTN|nr:hypothetical protein [Sinosporangium siamense]GII92432.1 hypothetical protein Ssi02_26630 [Sinosporangium siamense]
MRLNRAPRNGPAVLYVGAVGLASLLTLVVASSPGLSGWTLLLALYWLILVVIWPSWIWEPTMAGQRLWSLLVSLGFVLVTVLLVKVDVPLHVRFALSESSLERHARSAHAEEREDQWWGLFHVNYVEKIPEGTIFLVTDIGLDWLSHGFAYLPDKPPVGEAHRYEHFKGPWYRWSEGP